ncbi:MAG: chemotaxis protein CheW [Pseudomonadota bacterium]
MIDDFDAILDQRARELAVASDTAPPPPPVLVCTGRDGRWALPLAAVSRVEELPDWTPVPGWPPPILGLALVARRRVLLADLDGLAAGKAPRDAGRPGHAVLLRAVPAAVAVDRAEAVIGLGFPAALGDGMGVAAAADGTVLLDPDRLLEAMARRGAP